LIGYWRFTGEKWGDENQLEASGTQERFLSTTHQLLLALSKVVVLKYPDSEACDADFGEILSQSPVYANIGAILPDGGLVCSAVPTARRENFSDQPWFRSSLEAGDISLGLSQVAHGDGIPTLYFSYPVVDDSGKPLVVVFAAIDLSHLNQFAFQMQLPGMAEFLMVSSSGTVLGYWPDPEKLIGKSMPDAPLVDLLRPYSPKEKERLSWKDSTGSGASMRLLLSAAPLRHIFT
jgi:hypothetical protein